MKTNKEDDLVEVFAGPSIDAEIVKSMLADIGIEAFLKDEFMGTIAPWHTSPGGVAAVKVIISGQDADRAKEVVETFTKNRND